jgi:hypothetical protein
MVHTSGQEFGRMPLIREPKLIALHSGDSRSHRMVARYARVGHARVWNVLQVYEKLLYVYRRGERLHVQQILRWVIDG